MSATQEVMNQMMEYIRTTPNEELNTGILADGFLAVDNVAISYHKPNVNHMSLNVLRKFFPEIHTHLYHGELTERPFELGYKMYQASKVSGDGIQYVFVFLMHERFFNTFEAQRDLCKNVEGVVLRNQEEEA
jgi:hypothetical protein